jgi:hypothetical protein
MRTPTMTRAPYTGDSAIGSNSVAAVTMSDLTSIVFVVDDDVFVRESLDGAQRSGDAQDEGRLAS